MPRTDLPAAAGPPPGLTAAQAHILAAQSADPSYAGHNVGQYIELVGPLDTGALDEAVLHTLDEAPWLRSRLMSRGGLPRLDTSAAADPVGAAVALVRGQLACPPRPELLTAPTGDDLAPDLTGALLVTVGPRRHLLVQYFHLLAVDGYGVALLSRRIAEVYTALVHGRPPGPTPFAPLSLLTDADRAYSGSAAQAADRRYWTGRYADRPVPVSPAGRPAPAQDTARRHTVHLGAQDSAAVRAAARSAQVTWAEVVLATTAVRVTAQVGAREAVLAVYAAARTAPGTLRVPATAVNLLPVRLPVRGADTFRSLLRAAAGELTLLRRHQRLRGEELARELWPQYGGGRVPGPVVNLRPFETELDFGGIRGRVVSLASGPVDDLSVSAAAGPDGRLRLDFDVNPARYEEAEPARFARLFTEDLMALCHAPDVPVAALRASPTLH
ncbi:nonribosomal peptide synthetase DhbF/nonribosomal peptide synthetase MxcG [Streptomyces sp. CG 926]|uniref:condensation domain-containing protein n=1 Tax=Streptomyces sp. CG 926 TaxID=1882405 RepID=UPI000D6D10D0|nr:condensation domain-containing protein [Streptomyces sp. CG 926]PWK63363.1 nonribosomal peptide synthetase DhbF/nonribosomal peptide synthetase MxcG [Streptomyces sp. CG 926]